MQSELKWHTEKSSMQNCVNTINMVPCRDVRPQNNLEESGLYEMIGVCTTCYTVSSERHGDGGGRGLGALMWGGGRLERRLGGRCGVK